MFKGFVAKAKTLYPHSVQIFRISSKFEGRDESLQSSLIFSGEPFTYDLKDESRKFFTITLILWSLDEKSNLLIKAN